MAQLTIENESAPPATPVGGVTIYALDGKFYLKDAAGVVAEILAGPVVTAPRCASATPAPSSARAVTGRSPSSTRSSASSAA